MALHPSKEKTMQCESCEKRPAVGPVTVVSQVDGQTYIIFICASCAKLLPGD